MTITAIEQALTAYEDMGWSVFAIPDGMKKTTEEGWPDAPDDVRRVLDAQPANVAVRLGERSGHLADVDLDDEHARAVAPLLLPATGAVFGRDNVIGITHRLYLCPDGPPRGQPGTTKKGAVELRWTGAYTVLPPSRHPEGGRYRWQPGDYQPLLAPPPVAWSTLHRSVTEVAAAALLLRCYSEWAREGNRHLATMALSGALLSEGWDLPRVERFVFALATAGGDEEAADRVDNARSQFDALQRGQPMTGWPSLAGYAGRDAVDLVKRYLGIRSNSVWAAAMSSRQNGAGGAPGQPPQSTQTPNVAPKQPKPGAVASSPSGGAVAPVISTAAAAAAAAGKSKVNYSRQKVALDVAGGIQKLHPLARDEGGGLYLYEQGVYRLDDVAMRLRASIESEVLATYGEDYLDLHMEKEVLHRLTVQARVLPPAPPPGWLHVLNGRVNVRTGDLEPHSPDHGSTTLLPIVYDPAARCPAIERFCLQVFPADAMDLGVPWQVVALCALPLRGVDKAILLLGPGENGKGVFLDIVQAFVGVENASHVSLQSIAGDKYATADLRGKVLNLCSDLPSRVLDDSGDFKAIVSGEKIRAQRKNKDAFAFAPYCRLLFSANNLPESGDTSTGFFRRWYMIPFSVSFAPGNPLRRPRGELVAELTTPMELSGLLNLALVQMRRFMAGDPPDSSPSMDEAVEEFVAISDPFPSWLEAAVRAAPQAGPMAWIETAEVIRRYRERYERRGRWQPISPQAAGAAILARFPNAVRTRKRVGGSGQAAGTTGKQRWGWQGVEWRDPFRNGTP